MFAKNHWPCASPCFSRSTMRNSSRPLLLAGFLVALAFNTIAAQEPTQAERDAIRSACRSDFMAHCASVQPGGKEALECLVKNDSQLSPSCKSAVSAVVRKPEPRSEERRVGKEWRCGWGAEDVDADARVT